MDCANPVAAHEALKQANLSLHYHIYRNPIVRSNMRDVILPIAPFTETSGTFVNAAGEWQSFKGVAKAILESRPAWKVLRVLGNFCIYEGFEYEILKRSNMKLKIFVDKIPVITAWHF